MPSFFEQGATYTLIHKNEEIILFLLFLIQKKLDLGSKCLSLGLNDYTYY